MDQDERDAGTAGQERAQGADAGSPTTGGAAPPGTTPPAAGGDPAGGTRSQHVVHTLPHDWGTIPQFLSPALERLDLDAAETQLLIVTPDAETALAVAEAALAPRDPAGRGATRGDPAAASPVLAVTRVERAVRQLRARPAPAIAADPAALGALLRASALKLDTVRALVLAWADDVLESPGAEELDAVLAEVPKEATRILVAAEVTDEVEALIERALRRPRRIAPAAVAGSALAVSYVATAPSARPAALRRVLDELDPASATVVVASDASEGEARRAVRALGYGAGDEAREPETAEEAAQRELGAAAPAQGAAGPLVRVVRAGAPIAAQQGLVVLYDLPPARDAVEKVAAARPAQLVALVQPRQLGALRLLAAGPVRPLVLRDLGRRDTARDAALRTELRGEVSRGLPPRELRVLEELLEEFDGMELAAAALRLLERERARRATATAGTAPAPSAGAAAAPAGGGSGMTRLFVSVGSRDGARPGDLVGAITGEAGITSDKIGKIEVRESFALVEVANADAERVVAKVNGIAIRGRRVNVRPEREGGRPERGGDRPERGGGERRGPGGPGGGGKRTFAPRPGGGIGGERRPAGGGGPPRGGPPRGGGRTFDARSDGPRGFGAADDRPVRERAEQRGEWAERAERLQRARRRAPGAPDAGPADTEG